ncbi:MAG: energy-coupling factor transporter transmembrane protein EcfT [Nocardioidaceae bacterium]|nr:MAG: energy-coupling factor transporter transmembrane protein EcfT [Nocardioidaceae bacterium]
MLARDLHPAAWWIWALGLAAAASRTTNPWLLAMILLVACITVLARRTDAPWALGFRYYLMLGAFVIALRVVFRIIFGGAYGETVLLDLPEIGLPDWAAGITLLGPLTLESLLAGFYDGLRLATILICVGAANALANPKRLLAAMPAALYEVGTAVVVALSMFPQLVESLQRVRRARRLRGEPKGKIHALRRIVVPVMEDALERSIVLAASMDTRGYGRSGVSTTRQRALTGALLITGLIGLAVGSYAVLDSMAPRYLATPMLVFGVVLAGVGMVVAGRRVQRTRYRPDPWRLPETITAASGVLAAVLMYLAATRTPFVALPPVDAWPQVTLLATAAALVGLIAAVVSPATPMSQEKHFSELPVEHEVAL